MPLAIISFAYMRIAFRLWGSKTPGAAQDQRDHNILVNKKKVIIRGNESCIRLQPPMSRNLFSNVYLRGYIHANTYVGHGHEDTLY